MIKNKPFLGSQIDWSHPLANGLVSCVLLNEGSGTSTVRDIALQRDMDMVGVEDSDWVDGKIGRELNFTGGAKYLQSTGDFPVNGDSPITIMASLTDVNTGSTQSTVYISDISTANTYNGIRISDGNHIVGIYRNGVPFLKTIGDTEIISGETVHAAYVVNGLNDRRIYMNGVIDRHETNTSSFAIPTGMNTLGISSLIQPSQGYFETGIAYSYIWNRALSDQEIQQLYIDPYQFIINPQARLSQYFSDFSPAEVEPTPPSTRTRLRGRY